MGGHEFKMLLTFPASRGDVRDNDADDGIDQHADDPRDVLRAILRQYTDQRSHRKSAQYGEQDAMPDRREECGEYDRDQDEIGIDTRRSTCCINQIDDKRGTKIIQRNEKGKNRFLTGR